VPFVHMQAKRPLDIGDGIWGTAVYLRYELHVAETQDALEMEGKCVVI